MQQAHRLSALPCKTQLAPPGSTASKKQQLSGPSVQDSICHAIGKKPQLPQVCLYQSSENGGKAPRAASPIDPPCPAWWGWLRPDSIQVRPCLKQNTSSVSQHIICFTVPRSCNRGLGCWVVGKQHQQMNPKQRLWAHKWFLISC